jgi:hypothetical protein
MTPEQKKAIRYCARTLSRSFHSLEGKLIFRLQKHGSRVKVFFVDNDVDYGRDDEEQETTVNLTS